MTARKPLAVLIDADNVGPAFISGILLKAEQYGVPLLRRAYGSENCLASKKWSALSRSLAIERICPRSCLPGKNSTDLALTIDAMDLLYNKIAAAFCLVSSDSDFAHLAHRIREDNAPVHGFGEKKTPRSFAEACSTFDLVEALAKPACMPGFATQPVAPIPSSELKDLLLFSIANSNPIDGWVPLSEVGKQIHKFEPSFNVRQFGHKLLSHLATAQPYLKSKTAPSNNGLAPVTYVRACA